MTIEDLIAIYEKKKKDLAKKHIVTFQTFFMRQKHYIKKIFRGITI